MYVQTLRQNTEVPVERHASVRKEIATQTQISVWSLTVSKLALQCQCVLIAQTSLPMWCYAELAYLLLKRVCPLWSSIVSEQVNVNIIKILSLLDSRPHHPSFLFDELAMWNSDGIITINKGLEHSWDTEVWAICVIQLKCDCCRGQWSVDLASHHTW